MLFHPDRVANGDPSAVETAAFRMRELNDAWTVLRSPAGRARYDDELSSTREAMAGVGAGRGDPAGTAEAERRVRSARLREEWLPPVADLEPDVGAATARRPGSLRTYLPVVILVGILVAVVVVIAHAGGGTAPTDTPDVQTVEQFAVGTCVARGFGPDGAVDPSAVERDGAQARLKVFAVPCTTPGAATVVSRVPAPRPCPATTKAWMVPDGSSDYLCVSPNS